MNQLLVAPGELKATIEHMKGARLKALADAALDVAQGSRDPGYAETARLALQQIRLAHPELGV